MLMYIRWGGGGGGEGGEEEGGENPIAGTRDIPSTDYIKM